MFFISAGDTRRGAPPRATFSEHGGADEWQDPLFFQINISFIKKLMIDSKTVLIIIPTYNRQKLLPEAIQSVLTQDYPHKKIMIVDDGSTDHTDQVCRKFVNEHPQEIFYLKKENGGCASARNIGLEQAHTVGYVCFLDSDDRFLPGKLFREINLLDKNPKAGFTYADHILFDEETQREQMQKVAAAGCPDQFAIQHFLTCEAKSSAILYRAQIVKDRRFRENLKWNEDSDFLQRVALECQAVYCPTSSAWIRWHAGSKSKNKQELYKALLKSSLDILQDYPDFYRSIQNLADQRLIQIQRLLFQELISREYWSEANLYAQDVMDQWACRFHSKVLLKMKRYVKKIKSRFNF